MLSANSKIQVRCARRMTNDFAEGRVRKGITIDAFGHAWLLCRWLYTQTGEFTANNGRRGSEGHEAQNDVVKLC